MSTIIVKIPIDLKLKLEQEAAKDNMEFSQWLRLHLSQLKAQYPNIEILIVLTNKINRIK